MNRSRPINSHRRAKARRGFTLVELTIASSISVFVLGTLMTVFLRTSRVTYLARQSIYGQTEVRQSAQKIIAYLRGGKNIANIDTAGRWVEIEMPNGIISRFEYINPTEQIGGGQMAFVADISSSNAITKIVARGLTEVMTLPARNVFHQTSDNTLRLAYRVTKPMTPGDIPAEVDIGVYLRNH